MPNFEIALAIKGTLYFTWEYYDRNHWGMQALVDITNA